jgi:hypothetical protein
MDLRPVPPGCAHRSFPGEHPTQQHRERLAVEKRPGGTLSLDTVRGTGAFALRRVSGAAGELVPALLNSRSSLIEHQFSSDERDLKTMIQGGLLVERIFKPSSVARRSTRHWRLQSGTGAADS